MTQDEIIEMAREAGLDWDIGWVLNVELPNRFETFAKLVAAKATEEANERANASWTLMCKKMVALEREACAKIIEPTEEHRRDASWGYFGGDEGVEIFDALAAAIRARGEQA